LDGAALEKIIGEMRRAVVGMSASYFSIFLKKIGG
jgi:hypothetical protein